MPSNESFTSNERPSLQEDPVRRVGPDLGENEQTLQAIFELCSDVVFRSVALQDNAKLLLVYVDGMIDKDVVQSSILRPLIYDGLPQGLRTLDSLAQMCDLQLVAALRTSRVTAFEEAADAILQGSVAFLAEDEDSILLADVSQYETRAIEEPSTEATLRGTRESFTEQLRTNTTMLRRIITTPKLKMETFQVGKLTKTEVVLSYIDGIAAPGLIDQVRSRISAIDIPSVLESGYIEEYVEDTNYSPFPQMQSTERADVVSAGLLEGRIAIFISGTPIVLVAPMTFWDGLQAPDDYYERFLYVTMNRWIRYIFSLFSLLFPSIYIALTTYHPEMMPPKLMLSITGLREQSPLPTVIEVFLMEFMFEGLREAGIRLPMQIGPLVSIVGALVIGQAAVAAGIISAPIVIVVSAAGISSFVIPRYRFGYPFRMLRFPLLLLSGLFGLFGVALGLIVILSHLIQLSPLGSPYLEPIAPTKKNMLQNVFLRKPRKRTS
ncbi:spore germination protein [Paenibacillus sacheonensis]|uniref:Spore germination protein n=1 Tax=Paenibacillus sacheonensis TaxID=742054 RepID=A0A7X4YXE8_9BACL|nr:spore germination protein [Paenibacillus sacheonensis]MBM7569457.1 spore germination protein KA [Paenibacillus sacheonensis]NBC73374.1 spore germination protein [Paenibacillus sacheonensis]